MQQQQALGVYPSPLSRTWPWSIVGGAYPGPESMWRRYDAKGNDLAQS